MKLMKTSKIALTVMLLGTAAELPAPHNPGEERLQVGVPPRLINDPNVNHLPQRLRQHALKFLTSYNRVVDADANNPFSLYLDGILVFDGIGQVPNPGRHNWIEQAATAGFNPEAEGGDIPDFHQDTHSLYAQANAFYERYGAMINRLADEDNPIAQYLKGLIGLYGVGIEKNEDDAFDSLLASAQSGLYQRSMDFVLRRMKARLGEREAAITKARNLLKNPSADIQEHLSGLTGSHSLDRELMPDFDLRLFRSRLSWLPGFTERHFEVYDQLSVRLDELITTLKKDPITPPKIWGTAGALVLSGVFLGLGINRVVCSIGVECSPHQIPLNATSVLVSNTTSSASRTTCALETDSVIPLLTTFLNAGVIIGFAEYLWNMGSYYPRIHQTAKAAFCCRRTTVPSGWHSDDIKDEVRMTALFLTLNAYRTTNNHIGDVASLVSKKVDAVERLLGEKMPGHHHSLARRVMELAKAKDRRYPEFYDDEVEE